MEFWPSVDAIVSIVEAQNWRHNGIHLPFGKVLIPVGFTTSNSPDNAIKCEVRRGANIGADPRSLGSGMLIVWAPVRTTQ